MTKAEIINKIVEDTGLPKKDVAATVEAFMEEIRNCMAVEGPSKEGCCCYGRGIYGGNPQLYGRRERERISQRVWYIHREASRPEDSP